MGRRMAGSSSEIVAAGVAAAVKPVTRLVCCTAGCREIRTLANGNERAGSKKILNRNAGRWELSETATHTAVAQIQLSGTSAHGWKRDTRHGPAERADGRMQLRSERYAPGQGALLAEGSECPSLPNSQKKL